MKNANHALVFIRIRYFIRIERTCSFKSSGLKTVFGRAEISNEISICFATHYLFRHDEQTQKHAGHVRNVFGGRGSHASAPP